MSQVLEPIAPVLPELAEPEEPVRRLWTTAEYLRMAESGVFRPDERVELVGGEILTMPPQLTRHFAAVNLAGRACVRCFGEGYWVRLQGPLELGDGSMPEPDVAVVAGDIPDYREHHPRTALLIIEASDTTLSFDRRLKAGFYAAAGIADYWIQNLVDRTLEVRRGPQARPAAPSGWDYADVSVFRKGEKVTPLAAPGCEISVEELLPETSRRGKERR
jgi:Uma2 family endonuclease